MQRGTILSTAAILLLSSATASAQSALGTAFTYQGQLKLQDRPVNDTADFIFELWDSESGGILIGSFEVNDVLLIGGLFTVDVDFGFVMQLSAGQARWLDIAVRSPAGSGAFETLSPRQRLRPAPVALSVAVPAILSWGALPLTLETIHDGGGSAIFAHDGTFNVPAAGTHGIYAAASGGGNAVLATDVRAAGLPGAPTGDVIYAAAGPGGNGGNAIFATDLGPAAGAPAFGGNSIYSVATRGGNAVLATDAGAGLPAAPTGDVIYAAGWAGGNNAVFATTNATVNAPAFGTNAVYAVCGPGGHAVFASDGGILVGPGGDAIYATASGGGSAVHASADGPAGSAVVAAVTVALNASDAIVATTVGLGRAGLFSITNAASNARGLEGNTNGTGPGVFGVSGAPPAVFGPVAGVQGVSRDRRGVGGRSEQLDGVYGSTLKTGSINNLAQIVGGVHGVSAPVTTIDNFGVVGTGGGYGVGVLGVGAGKGHGVIGVPGYEAGFVSAGVRGVTRERADGAIGWPPHFALKADPDKRMVGVLGQAVQLVGVWGESLEKIGVVGTTGDELAFDDLPTTPTGVYGAASQDEGAGVLAEGNGTSAPGNPRAAALEIRNGAINVSGDARPAGTIPVGAPAGFHVSGGVYWDVILVNPLIKSNSIILLTVETLGTLADGLALVAQLDAKSNGSAIIRVATNDCDANQDGMCDAFDIEPVLISEPVVHYLIVNPVP